MKKATLLFTLLMPLFFVANSSAADVKKSEQVKITVKEADSDAAIVFANVCILEKGKIVSGNQTDFDGQCTFPAENKKRNLKISCLGFNATELTIEKGSGNIVVKLQRSNIFLKELIVNACFESRCTRGCCCCCRCITTTTCVQTIPTIEEKKSASSDQGFDFTIYPNPSSGRIKIKSTYTDFSLEIFDINGRLVYSVKELTDELEQNLDFLLPGTYVARVTSGAETKTSRVVIE